MPKNLCTNTYLIMNVVICLFLRIRKNRITLSHCNMESTIRDRQQKIIYLKWAPVNETEQKEKSYGKDKKKVEDGNIMETVLQEGQDFISSSSKRETQSSKLNEREWIKQTNMNPFLQSTYLEDLQTQENFLIPQNSNMTDNFKNV